MLVFNKGKSGVLFVFSFMAVVFGALYPRKYSWTSGIVPAIQGMIRHSPSFP
jgi:hypothetical protein